jgi:phosphonate transport system substrate-binding protein
MASKFSRFLFGAAAAGVALLVSCSGDAEKSVAVSAEEGGSRPSGNVLRFSAIPDQDKTELQEKFAALADYLSRELGVQVEYVPSSDYKASVEMFKNSDIQLSWFGGLTGVQARAAVPGSLAIVQGREDPEYLSYFIAHRDTGIEPSDSFPKAIAQKSFTFGSESSTSGRLMPAYFIRQETGKSPEAFFAAAPGFSGSHDKTALLVASGQVEAGVLSYTTFDKLVAEGKINPEVVRIIWRTPTYADYNFTAHPALEEMFGIGFIDRLQKVLIEIDDPDLLSAFPRKALISAKNSDYSSIEKVAVELGFLR